MVMCKTVVVAAMLAACPGACMSQVSGNIGYAQAGGRARAEQSERSKRVMTSEEMPPGGSSMFIEASVLMNVPADEYVAWFGISQDGASLADCTAKMAATIDQFVTAVKPLGIGDRDVYVDFIAQNRIYGYTVSGDVAAEHVTGFELKKNVAIHYRDSAMLDRLVAAAAQAQVFDLIKVDYVVDHVDAVEQAVREQAARIVRRKISAYGRMFGVKLAHPTQVYADRPSIYYPTDMYDAYTAYEAEDVTAPYYRQKYVVENARKSTTFYYNGLNGAGFDLVVNPVVLRPPVQFTLYMRVRCTVENGGVLQATEARRSRKARATRS